MFIEVLFIIAKMPIDRENVIYIYIYIYIYTYIYFYPAIFKNEILPFVTIWLDLIIINVIINLNIINALSNNQLLLIC